jgi:valine--pyruvate aminotransferase
MAGRWSKFGERFTRPTGALELMDDLGRAMETERPALLLGGGNPGRIPEVQALFKHRLAEIAASDEGIDRMLGNYAHPKGELGFRRALAGLLSREYGWAVTADNVALTAGSQAGFFQLFNLIAGEFSDGSFKRILLPVTPEYIGYADVGLSAGLFRAQLPRIEERPDGFFKYRVDFDALEIGSDTAAVCVSRPTNPTGNVITDAELAQLDKMARTAGVPLIVDNAYGLPFPNIVFTEAAPVWNDNVILCMSLSKLGMPGARTGIIVANETLTEALTSMTAVQSLAVGSMGAVFVEDWIESGEIIDISRRYIRPFYERKARAACQLLKHELGDVPFRIHTPEGAFFLWLWVPGLPITSAELYDRLKRRGVFVLSGHHFFPGITEPWPHRDECLRVSYAQDDAVVEAGVRILAEEVRGAFGRGR